MRGSREISLVRGSREISLRASTDALIKSG